jgi:chromosome segregation protein
MTDRSQFVLISHSKTTMQASDVLYGVTMEVPGISKLVSVELKKRGGDASTSGQASEAVAVA